MYNCIYQLTSEERKMTKQENIVNHILKLEGKELLQKALLLSDNKQDAFSFLNDIFDEAVSQLWKKEAA